MQNTHSHTDNPHGSMMLVVICLVSALISLGLIATVIALIAGA